jgi:hypothetical protein
MPASLIETCKLHRVNPQAYLTDVLTKLVNNWPKPPPRRTDPLGLNRRNPLTGGLTRPVNPVSACEPRLAYPRPRTTLRACARRLLVGEAGASDPALRQSCRAVDGRRRAGADPDLDRLRRTQR